MSDVFISYKQDERDRMRPIAEALRALGVDVWFDSHLQPDRPFTEEIREQIDGCKAQIVCWSPAAVKSEWVRGEAEVGRIRGVLICVSIEPCLLDPPFNVIHAEPLAAWQGEHDHPGWLKVAAAVGRKLQRPGLADLSKIIASQDAARWRDWAAKYPTDPFANEAWAKAETLHLDAERARIARERDDALSKAREREDSARRATQAEQARLAAVQERADQARTPRETRAADPPKPRPPASSRLIAGGAIAIAALGMGWTAYTLLTSPPPSTTQTISQAEADWRLAAQQDTISALQNFLLLHPDSEHALLARGRIAELQVAAQTAEAPALPQRSPPPPPPPPLQPPVAVCPTSEFVVYFEWDRANLNPAAIETIDSAVARAQQCTIDQVLVVGHDDTADSAAESMGISSQRAASVRDALIARGVPASAIGTQARGESDLARPTADGVREPLNRRASVTITFK